MTEDFYDLLDIPPDASQDEIKDAYRDQVRVYHPDLNDDDRAQAQFTAVKKAYDILGDPVERQAYDRLGHEDYVAKRTSGLPSPDVWKSNSDSDGSGESSETATATASATASGSSTTTSSGSSSGTTASSGSTATGASTGAGSGNAASGTGNATSGAGNATASGSTTSASGTTATSGTAGSGQTSSTDGGTAHGAARSSTAATGSGSAAGGFGDNAVVRWWRRQNFSLPLIWLSVLVYLGGFGHFASANAAGLEALRAELTAVGADPAGLWEVLSTGRYGVDSTYDYLLSFALVSPPFEAPLWDAALAGVVALTLLALLGVRVYRDRETWGAVSIDETIVVAFALTATTLIVGGPLLAGAVLMPFLFGVIVRHTRRGPGWKPSYLYVLPVLAPLVGFGLAAAGAATLATDLLAFGIFPIVGGLGLPLRATIRKRFGR
ncbi:J domain-containing protein [Haloterrigena alkaliphila]|uniref:J domain-containing protein n=1 Tax=Haloterrigena alkaliphila TaxID=2816475 RepID=A0A8A2VED4_9EURY|nr:J domain-containing protein [Haloterrigena alkaliphila]QSW99070.1 J domain-containing protein [Haloterrigena alkaliphila]